MRARLCAQSYVETHPRALEPGEELARLLSEHDAGKGRELAHDADAGVTGDQHKEARLALGEAFLHDGLNGIVKVHRSNSSARRGSRPRPPLLPVLAVMPRP